MPKKLEQRLQREARAKGFRGKRFSRYVYGGLRNTGWKPKPKSKRRYKGL